MRPHGTVTYADRYGFNCERTTHHGERTRRGYFSNVSAYTWKGNALGAQVWDSSLQVDRWYVPGTRSQWVAFDGITFTNHTRHTVLVAGWCD